MIKCNWREEILVYKKMGAHSFFLLFLLLFCS